MLGSRVQERTAESHYLDVLRGLAAITVVVSHADHSGLLALGLDGSQKMFLGRVGVYLFFILSGFLIWRSAQHIDRPRGWQIYGIHRATRLLPLYFVNIAFVVLVLPHLESAFQPQVAWEALVRHITLTQDLNPSVSRTLNPVLWTLTHEAIFYAVVPLLRHMGVAVLPAVSAALLILSWIPSMFSGVLGFFPLFVVGILVAERRVKWAVVTLSVFVMSQAVADRLASEELAGALMAGGVFLLSRALPNWGLKLSLPLRWVGVVSYSLYIWHYLFINLLGTQSGLRAMHAMTAGLSANAGVRGALFMTLVLLISLLSYYLIERPGMGWLRKRIIVALGGAAPLRSSTR